MGVIELKNPNGYGSVFKLSGNRRKPWAVRITTGWTEEGKQTYEYLGYFTTRQEAMIALADYNSNPYDLSAGKITFKEVYEDLRRNVSLKSQNQIKVAMKWLLNARSLCMI